MASRRSSVPRTMISIGIAVQWLLVAGMLFTMIGVYDEDYLYSALLLSMIWKPFLTIVIINILFGAYFSVRALTAWFLILEIADIIFEFIAFVFRVIWNVQPRDVPCDAFFPQCVVLTVLNGCFLLVGVYQIIAVFLYNANYLDPNAIYSKGPSESEEVTHEYGSAIHASFQSYSIINIVQRSIVAIQTNPELAKSTLRALTQLLEKNPDMARELGAILSPFIVPPLHSKYDYSHEEEEEPSEEHAYGYQDRIDSSLLFAPTTGNRGNKMITEEGQKHTMKQLEL